MKKGVFGCLYVLCLVLLVVWMIQADSVIIASGGLKAAVPVEFSSFTSKDTVTAYFTEVYTMNSFREETNISGWAFVETEYDNSDKYISIILKNDDHCYEIREDRITPSKGRVVLSSDRYTYPNDLFHFENVYSLLKVADGLYDLYIYCWENEHNYGLTDSGYQLDKKDGMVVCNEWRAELLTSDLTATESTVCGHAIAPFTIQEDYASTWGWAVVDGVDATNQQITLRFVNENDEEYRFSTKQKEQADAEKIWGDAMYKMCGYRTSFSLSDLPDGQWTITALLAADGKVYESHPTKCLKENKTIELIEDP